MQGEKHETSTKTWNETMLRDKLRVFCISYFAALTLAQAHDAETTIHRFYNAASRVEQAGTGLFHWTNITACKHKRKKKEKEKIWSLRLCLRR